MDRPTDRIRLSLSVSDIQDGSAGRVRASLSSETLTTIIDPEPVAYVLLKREKSNTPCIRGMKRGKKREGLQLGNAIVGAACRSYPRPIYLVKG